jgi:hypothetical protein
MMLSHRFVVSFASVAAALSLMSVSLAAETAPVAEPAESTAPQGCQIDIEDASTSAIVTPTATTTPTTTTTSTSTLTTSVLSDDEDEVEDEAKQDNYGQAVRACVEALRAEGEHGYGQIVSEFAHEMHDSAEAEHGKRGHKGEADQDEDSATTTTTASVSATPTATSTSTTTSTTTATTSTTTESTEHGKGQGKNKRG